MAKHICVLSLVFLLTCFMSQTINEVANFCVLCVKPAHVRPTSLKFEHELRNSFQKYLSGQKYWSKTKVKP